MSTLTHRKHHRSVTGKVIIALLLVAITFFLLWRINKVGFEKVLHTTGSLSRPNPKLKLVNNIFRDVVYLDHMQRTQALQNSNGSYQPVLKASARLNAMLDTLRVLSNTPDQIQRVDSIKVILKKRDQLFLNYLKLRTDLLQNDTLTRQFRTLSETFARSRTDSLLSTAQRITTIMVEPGDTVQIEGEKTTFWDRLWGRKKPAEAIKLQKLITEELNIQIDTIALAKNDSALQKLGSLIEEAEEKRRGRRENVIRKQRQLTMTNNMLVSQLFAILEEIEREEIQNAELNLAEASDVVRTGFTRMITLLIVFIIGAALLTILFFIDISQSKKYRTQLIEAKEEAEHLSQVKQRFLANMSHELRTPLQAIIGVAEQMKTNEAADGHQIDIIYHSSQHLLQTVNEVLDYSKIVSGSFRLEYHPFDMLQLLAEVCSIMEVRAQEKNLAFLYAPTIARATWYLGDAFRLKQILFNLLGNAIKFTDEGKITFRVSSQSVSKGAQFTFEIEDTGRGIAPEDLDNIFTQFEQGSSRQSVQEGTGLGLSIVKELVSLHGGKVSVRSTPGKGSVFSVVLEYPLAAGQHVVSETDENIPMPAFEGEVWMVDDDPYVLQFCKSSFQKHRIAYRLFSNPEELLREANNINPAVILMDIRMPQMTGFELLRRLKQKGVSARCIALTAQVLPEERNELLSKGFDDLLLKPFGEQELLKKILQRQAAMTAYESENKFDNQSLKKVFLDATQDDLVALRRSLAVNDAHQVAEYLHRLAGRTAQFDLKHLSREFRRYELALRNDTESSFVEKDIEALVHTTEEIIKNY